MSALEAIHAQQIGEFASGSLAARTDRYLVLSEAAMTRCDVDRYVMFNGWPVI
jgi:hypothetical protein